jgi:hypothetical protein
VVRDLLRQRNVNNSLVGTFHLGPTDSPQTLGKGQYRVGDVRVSVFSSVSLTISFTLDQDQNSNPVGQPMHLTVPAATKQVEIVSVISDVATGLSYLAGVLTLSTGQSVTFGNGGVSLVTAGTPTASLSASNLAFSFTQGGAFPAPQAVAVTRMPGRTCTASRIM